MQTVSSLQNGYTAFTLNSQEDATESWNVANYFADKQILTAQCLKTSLTARMGR